MDIEAKHVGNALSRYAKMRICDLFTETKLYALPRSYVENGVSLAIEIG